MKNRILSAFIAVALALTIIPAFTLTVSAAETVTIDGIEYSIENGEATVTEGPYSGSIVIPATITSDAYPVTAIGNYALCNSFEDRFITSIAIPASVESIGEYAFKGCADLTTVTFAEGSKLESIGYQAFRDCGITSIAIPEGVTTIGNEIFENCNSLIDIYCVSGSVGENYAEEKYPDIPRTLFTFDDRSEYNIPSGRVGTTYTSSTELATTEKSTSTITYTIEPHIDGLSVVDNKLVYTRPATAQAATTAKIKASDGILSKTIEINIGEVKPQPPTISIGTQPTDASVTEGSITGNLTVSATVSDSSTPSYQWYACSNAEKANTTDITDATSSSYAIPTAITAGTYYYFCRVSADNAASVDSNVVTVTVSAAPVAPTITTTSLPSGTVGTAYSQTLQATSSTPITWTYETGSSIPGGLILDSDTGEISGTPTAAGTYDITVKATNTGGEDTKQLSIEIVDAPVTPPTGGSTGGSKSKKYDITKGAGSEWSGEEEGLTITADGELKNFLRVEVDGNVVSKNNYDAKSGSTIVTLKSDYLKTLSVGTHKMTIVFKNGTANTSFKITALDELAAGEGMEFSEIPVAVQNGIPFMIISILFTAGMIIYKRKRV